MSGLSMKFVSIFMRLLVSWGNSGNSVRLLFLGAPKSQYMVIAATKLRDAYSLEGKL